MESKKSRIPTWLVLVAVTAGLPFALYAAVWEYMNATATPLHPDARRVPTATDAAPPTKWTDTVEQTRKILQADLAERNLPGLSVAVGLGNEIVWAEGFGYADLENKVAVTPRTRFRIGTASTALTSAALGLLLEKGKLKLDDRIQTYVPGFPKKKWPITLRQLMGHLAGIGTDGGDEGPLFSQHCDRPSEALPAFADDPLRFEPGTQFRYSSYGWILLSAVAEAAAGEPFLGFMRKQVFDPLGMDNTVADSGTVEAPTAPSPDQATSYFPRFSADPRYGPDVMRDLDYSCYSGSSVFVSTPSDLVRFGMALHRGQWLQPVTVQLLQTSQRLPSGEETGYGLGFDLETVLLAGRQTRLVGHDGDLLGGMAASFMTFPEHGLVVAITSNTSYADTFSLAVKVAQVFTERR